MTAQVIGFPVDAVEKHIADAIARGQRVTEWQRITIAAWAQRNPKLPAPKPRPRGHITIRYSDVRLCSLPDTPVLPALCNCFYCGDGALIFPAEEGVPGQYPQGDGAYCICPCCTFNDCQHKAAKRRAAP